jgi:hypothetical protein
MDVEATIVFDPQIEVEPQMDVEPQMEVSPAGRAGLANCACPAATGITEGEAATPLPVAVELIAAQASR